MINPLNVRNQSKENDSKAHNGSSPVSLLLKTLPFTPFTPFSRNSLLTHSSVYGSPPNSATKNSNPYIKYLKKHFVTEKNSLFILYSVTSSLRKKVTPDHGYPCRLHGNPKNDTFETLDAKLSNKTKDQQTNNPPNSFFSRHTATCSLITYVVH